MRHTYVAEYTYGQRTVDDDGLPYAKIYRFASATDARAFVGAARTTHHPPDSIDPMYREIVPASDPLVRRAKRDGRWIREADAEVAA